MRVVLLELLRVIQGSQVRGDLTGPACGIVQALVDILQPTDEKLHHGSRSIMLTQMSSPVNGAVGMPLSGPDPGVSLKSPMLSAGKQLRPSDGSNKIQGMGGGTAQVLQVIPLFPIPASHLHCQQHKTDVARPSIHLLSVPLPKSLAEVGLTSLLEACTFRKPRLNPDLKELLDGSQASCQMTISHGVP